MFTRIHHIVAFAARLDDQMIIRSNHEHVDCKWIYTQDVKKIIKWPEQVRLIYMIHDILTTDGILQEWQIPVPE